MEFIFANCKFLCIILYILTQYTVHTEQYTQTNNNISFLLDNSSRMKEMDVGNGFCWKILNYFRGSLGNIELNLKVQVNSNSTFFRRANLQGTE